MKSTVQHPGRKRPRLLVSIVLAALLVGALSFTSGGSAFGASGDDAKPKRGGSLSYAAQTEVANFDPAAGLLAGIAGQDRGNLIYDTLADITTTGVFKPRLAQSLTTTDYITWQMALQPNLVFSDGTPLDATAVVASIQRHNAPGSTSVAKADVDTIASLVATDATHVTFTMKAPSSALPAILSAHAGMIVDPAQIQADPTGWSAKPIGAGPFMIESWTRDSQLQLVRNPKYFKKGQPYLNSVTVRLITTAEARTQCMLSGDCDMTSLDAATAAALPSTEFQNNTSLATGGFSVVANQQQAPGDDIRVREAISLAFDPQETNQAVMFGLWKPAEWVCPPFSASRPECEKGTWPKPNLAKAKKLMSEYLAEPGHSPDVKLLTYATQQAWSEYVQQVLNKIGLKVTLDVRAATVDYATALRAHDYQMTFAAQTPFDYAMPKAYQYVGQKGFNYPNSQNAALEAATIKARDALSPADRVAAWKEWTRELNTNFDFMWVSPIVYGYATSKDIHMPGYSGGTTFYANNIWRS
jgi:peptide/nickel transport system substrate-binding protein